MTLHIDTGADAYDATRAYRIGTVQATLDNTRDTLGPDATQAEIDDAVILLILGDLRTPKTLATVRRHLIMWWPTLADIAEREPDLFDSVLMEFAEIATCLS